MNEFSGQIFEKHSNIQFHENLSSGSRVVPCGLTDMTKLMVAFPNSANAPKNGSSVLYSDCKLHNFTFEISTRLEQSLLSGSKVNSINKILKVIHLSSIKHLIHTNPSKRI